MKTELHGTIRALLDEYKRAIDELASVIRPLSSRTLLRVVDDKTTDANCRSVQTILTHVIFAGHTYTVYMENHIGHKKERPPKAYFETADEYVEALHRMFDYCKNFFIENPSIQLEESDQSKKITTSWKQQYDPEQLMEHAVVHVLKHRRQIERFVTVPDSAHPD